MGSRIDEPLTMTRSSTTYYYLTDGLGSVRQLTNASGTIVESYDYDPYGGTTIYDSSLTDITSTGSGIDNPYMFTGRRFDEETGIYHYRRRAYDPGIGRFLQRDPIGYAAGMNLYSYTWNNPINYIDPKGLIPPIPPLPIPPPMPGDGADSQMCEAGGGANDDDGAFPEQEPYPEKEPEEETPQEENKEDEIPAEYNPDEPFAPTKDPGKPTMAISPDRVRWVYITREPYRIYILLPHGHAIKFYGPGGDGGTIIMPPGHGPGI